MNAIKNWWTGLSDSTRDHIISAVRVFFATFLAVGGAAIEATGTHNLSPHLIVAALTAGLGAGISAVFKLLIQTYAPASLGGKK